MKDTAWILLMLYINIFHWKKKCNVREYAGVINYISPLNLEEPGLCWRAKKKGIAIGSKSVVQDQHIAETTNMCMH